MLDPSRAYYQRQLESATGLQIRAVQRELERLTSVGLLYRRAEGNRIYYQADTGFDLFPELRGMILKSADPVDALRGGLTLEPSILLAFLSGEGNSVLVVIQGKTRWTPPVDQGLLVEVMSEEVFRKALSEKQPPLDAYLGRGVDLLGRREGVIWRHIEAAGYEVPKGEGVP